MQRDRTASPDPQGNRKTAAVDWQLRAFDVVLALALLPVAALPLALAWMLGHVQHQALVGRGGRAFVRARIELAQFGLAGLLRRLGVGQWPVLGHILWGEMSWVGPRPRAAGVADGAAAPAIRPGLVSRWCIARRTAIDFEPESEMDAQDLRTRSLRSHVGLLVRYLLVAWLPQRVDASVGELRVGSVRLDNLRMVEALDRIEQLAQTGNGALVSFVNAACVNLARTNRGYRRALERAELVLPDGIGMRLAGLILGTPVRQNVNGTDLFPRLMARLQGRRTRVYLLGGHPGIPERVAQEIGRRWPAIQVVGLRDGFWLPAQEGEVVAAIRCSQADLLLVARGVPLQEVFMDRYGAQLGVRLAIGVGGLFDFVSGRIPRAPLWVRELGAEWVYRFLQEPMRMGRRYWLGNFSFLARVLWQRFGAPNAAKPAAEAPTVSPPDPSGAPARAVLFATPLAHPDLPLAQSQPAALLPVGHATLIERQIEELARVGVRQIDVVACDAPEVLRQRVGDGGRWGVEVCFHLVKDPHRPYSALFIRAIRQSQRVVVGHTDCWIDARSLHLLVTQDRIAVFDGPAGGAKWSGWVSGPGEQLLGCKVGWSFDEWAAHLALQTGRHLRLNPRSALACLDAPALLQVQGLAAAGRARLGAPASWRTMPWGAAHPTARIDPAALVTGPVLVGPGCVVEGEVQLGPQAYLAEDVLVSKGSQVRNSVVFAQTLIGAGLELNHTLANGTQLGHLGLAVKTTLPAEEGLMLSLQPSNRIGLGRKVGHAVAALVWLIALPIAGPLLAFRRLARGSPMSVKRQVMLAPATETQPARQYWLRLPVAGLGRLDRMLCGWAQLLEIAAGRCAWFGARPRSASQWYALNPAWQKVLAQAPVGLLNASAWTDDENCRADAEAAADVYFATCSGWRVRWAALTAALGVQSGPNGLASPTIGGVL